MAPPVGGGGIAPGRGQGHIFDKDAAIPKPVSYPAWLVAHTF
jgi:hypothetical protein